MANASIPLEHTFSSSLTILPSFIPDPSRWTPCLLGAVLLVAVLRFRRIKSMQKHYGYNTRQSMANMTDQEAFEIQKSVSELEFPSIYEKGLQFALFRTYGIPSISDLLVKTSQLSSNKNVGKRYADTAVLVVEIFGNPPTSDRAIDGFARLNYLHGHYIKQGKISNDDMLYTLALFMNSPVEWINKTEWRQLTDLEVCAVGVFHKSMGDAMEIKFDPLPGSKDGFKDGLQFYEQLDTWSKDYETKFMVPHRNNYLTAIQTRNLLLSTIPPFIHPPIKDLLAAAMDDRLRKAIMFDEPSSASRIFFKGFISLRRFFLRHLALPRPSYMRSPLVNEGAPDAKGRRTFRRYDTLPYYVKPTFMNRWGPGAWVSRMMGTPLPGDSGMAPEGFATEDVGPSPFLGKGALEAEATKERLRRQRTGGCPFVMRK